jgi:transcriptional regulator with XRE-family HTH domain
MQRLAAWLRDEAHRRGGVRKVSRLTGVGVSTLSRIINEKLDGRPELETLVKLSEGLNRPLADLVEMAEVDLGLPGADDALLARLRAEASQDPLLAEILTLLRNAPEEDRRAVLKYLRGALSSGQ